jgi:hypothetical protein
MTPAALIDRAHAAGLALSVTSAGKLAVDFKSEPPADLLAVLKANRDAVIAALSPAPRSQFSEWQWRVATPLNFAPPLKVGGHPAMRSPSRRRLAPGASLRCRR